MMKEMIRKVMEWCKLWNGETATAKQADPSSDKREKELARRISLLVKRRVYGDKKSVHSGPMCTGMTVNHEGKAVLSFEAGTDKLWAVDELKGFAIAGADGHFQWAEAVVVNGNQVAVWHKDIPHPVTVRYGWDDNPVHANLKNRTGLPASPFQISLEDK